MLINKNSHWKKELIELRSIFKKAMDKDLSLRDAFSKLTPGKHRDCADHIGGAKREATQIGRLEKSITMIIEGKGIYDKYKNC
jgi:uncharacterized protein YdeI (YjbR/CyaY-like superfamily)